MSVHHALQRRDFLSFLAKSFGHLHPGEPLDLTWAHQAMAFELEDCFSGGNQQLIITMPPRSLKSMTISVAWPAWLLGRHPHAKIMCVSYGEDLAKRHSMDTRRVMSSAFYRELFPRTVLTKDTEMVLETTCGGGRFATTVGGAVTGLGADWIIVDDPSKADDALSKPLLEKAITFFTGTLSTRLNDPVTGRIILTMQRLHEDDLAGFLLACGGWRHLTLPAIAENYSEVPIGPGLFHSRKAGDLLEPIRMPNAILDKRRALLGSFAFQAQFQQAPLPAGGNLIKRDWLSHYQMLPDRTNARIIQSLDTAQKTEPSNDYTVLTTWLSLNHQHYLIDVFRERCDFPALKAKTMAKHDEFRPERILIEDAGSGTSLIQELKATRPDIVTVPIKPKDSKSVRVGAASALFENRQVHFPLAAPWLDHCLSEVLGFPSAKHDDVIDSIAQYLNWMRAQALEVQFDYDMMQDARPCAELALDLYRTQLGMPLF